MAGLPTIDPISALEDVLIETVRQGSAGFGDYGAVNVDGYQGEMSVQNVLDALRQLVQRQQQFLIGYVGSVGEGDDSQGLVGRTRLTYHGYTASMNLYGGMDRAREAHMLITMARRTLARYRSRIDAQPLGYTGRLPSGEVWQAIMQDVTVPGDTNIINTEGMACYQVTIEVVAHIDWLTTQEE